MSNDMPSYVQIVLCVLVGTGFMFVIVIAVRTAWPPNPFRRGGDPVRRASDHVEWPCVHYDYHTKLAIKKYRELMKRNL